MSAPTSPVTLNAFLVVASQFVLALGFVWFAADHWAGPNDEAIGSNYSAIGVAGIVLLGLLVWARGIRWPLIAFNAVLAVGFVFALFLLWRVPIWGDLGIALSGLGLACTVLAVALGRGRKPIGTARG